MVAAAGRETGRAAEHAGLTARAGRLLAAPGTALRLAFEREWDERRFFLWLPAAAGSGVVLYFEADREPVAWFAALLTLIAIGVAATLRRHRGALLVAAAIAAAGVGFTAAALRTASLAHPVLDRIRIAKLVGVVEEVDHRRVGARFVLRVTAIGGDGLPAPPFRVRLTTRRADPLEAGMTVALTARLVPPSRAALPNGYDFARDAYFAGFTAVGSALGPVAIGAATDPPGLGLRFTAAVDRARNALAARVSAILPGDTGAIAAAMVTGKRDLLSDDGRELIREAGIFHIITIAGVQMTLVAAMLFGGLRAILAAVPPLALRYPIKAWAAAGAMAGAVAYDIMTGSRIGTQRALIMTLIVFGAILVERRAFTMRNLALAALAVILIEPETLLGASFQLSFSAVAALVAVSESGLLGRHGGPGDFGPAARARAGLGWLGTLSHRVASAVRTLARLLVSTVAATSATAPVMASNFHEISPFVVIGNPLTLSVIEFFAVPGALLGSLLYPLGLDRFVWIWVGWGIELVLWGARIIAATPGAALDVPAFAPWALACFTLATCSAVIWRSAILRLSAVPLFALGLMGAVSGPRYDLIVTPTGDAIAWRTPAGALALAGHVNRFAAGQWLTADGDNRDPDIAHGMPAVLRCDPLACIARGPGDRLISLVFKPDAFAEDCRRADTIVTPLYAPASCAAETVIDRGTLAMTGALAFVLRNQALVAIPTRAPDEDRPWSPAPRPLRADQAGRRRAPMRPGATAETPTPDADPDTTSDTSPDPPTAP